MVVFLVLVNFESLLRVSFIMENHHLSVWILVRVPAFDVSFLIRDFVAFLGVFMVARRESKFITVRSMDALLGSNAFERTFREKERIE